MMLDLDEIEENRYLLPHTSSNRLSLDNDFTQRSAAEASNKESTSQIKEFSRRYD